MVKGHIELQNPERFEGEYKIDKQKLWTAVEKATDKLLRVANANPENYFPGTSSQNYKYVFTEKNANWECGMYTGCFWLAYLLTGELKFRKIAEKHFESFVSAYENNVSLNDHDVGFRHVPSVIAEYKITGNEAAGELAKKVLSVFYDNQFVENPGFIMRCRGDGWPEWDTAWCRTMMDSLMNTAFFFWGYENTGDEKYRKAALSQINITNELIVREDGSTFHQYQFDPKTKKSLYGVTLQGFSDSSCWSRGQAWGAYGFPIAYAYSGEEYIKELSKNVINYTLNHLPSDLIPNWDYNFVNPFAPRDASAGVITACGMHELAGLLPDTDKYKKIYENASARLLEAVIDNCTNEIGVEYDGLISHVTHAYTIDKRHDECAVYGDFFYLEALARHLLPDFNKFW